MKYVKMLGLAAVAAMALMAFAAGSASATTLSSGGKVLPKGTTILASLAKGETAELKETGVNGQVLDTCTAGTVHGVTDQETGEHITGVAAVGWGEKGTECTHTTDTLKGGTITIVWTAGINGTVKSSNAEVTVETLGLTCTYGTSSTGTTLGTLNGSTTTNATISINANVEKKGGSFLCPGSAVWNAKYVVTVPSTLQVTK